MHPRGQVARGVDAGHGRCARHRVHLDIAVVIECDADCLDEVDLTLGWMREENVAGDAGAAFELDGFELAFPCDQLRTARSFQLDSRGV